MKRCPRCDRDRLLTDFAKNKSRHDGRCGWCKDCDREVQAERRRHLRARVAIALPGEKRCTRCRLVASFRSDTAQASGLASRCKLCDQRPLPGVELMQKHEDQDGKCAICQSGITIQKTRVDHCHATGVVRDLLCNNCNCGLGFFADDPARMRSAAAYIERHRQLTSV